MAGACCPGDCRTVRQGPPSVRGPCRTEAEFCADALNEAITHFGPPEIMNTDQRSQFTAFAWTDRLRRASVRISMDGKGLQRAFAAPPARRSRLTLDNIFIERSEGRRSMTYECVHLPAWETGSEARASLRTWFDVYNHRRPHAALKGRPPDVACRTATTITQPDQKIRRVA